MPTLIENTSQDEVTALYQNKYVTADTRIVGINDGTTFETSSNQEELKAIIGMQGQYISANNNGVLLNGLNDSFEFETDGYDEVSALRGIESQQRTADSNQISIGKVNERVKVVITQTIDEKEVSTIYTVESTEQVFHLVEELKQTNKSEKIKWKFKRIKI